MRVLFSLTSSPVRTDGGARVAGNENNPALFLSAAIYSSNLCESRRTRSQVFSYGCDHLIRTSLHAFLVSVAADLGIQWRFVRIVNARESLNFSRAGPPVQPFRITLLANLQRGIYVNFHKIPDPAAYFLSRVSIRRYCGNENQNSIASEQFGDESDPAHVFVAVAPAEAQVPVQVISQIVSVEQLHTEPTCQEHIMY